MANQRLRKSFERVKAQVDLDLLHFRKDVAALLQQDDSQSQDVLERCSSPPAASCCNRYIALGILRLSSAEFRQLR